MLDRMEIERQICKIKKHGDCAQDVRDLAMLLYVREHIDDHDADVYNVGHKLTREQAETWVKSMRGEDPAVPTGGKWTMEQVEPIAIKYGVQPGTEDAVELWATMNAMYSDYFGIAKKYNVNTPEFYADMAMAFIHDKDAKPGKVAMYYKNIAK